MLNEMVWLKIKKRNFLTISLASRANNSRETR